MIAVEPLDGMRGILERVVPDVEALPGRAEPIPLDDASVDAVFAAQAFHWFDDDRAIPEIARVLRPGGVLALVWNGPDESRPTRSRPPTAITSASFAVNDRRSTIRLPGATSSLEARSARCTMARWRTTTSSTVRVSSTTPAP